MRALAGKTHGLYSAAAIVRDGEMLFQTVAEARLTMRELSSSFIARYHDSCGEAIFQTVGAYQIESLGIQLFREIRGDHPTILGLPLLSLLAYFREAGYLLG